MAGKRYKFCVDLLKAGGCWKILRRRVRTAIRVNHCLMRRDPSVFFFGSTKPSNQSHLHDDEVDEEN